MAKNWDKENMKVLGVNIGEEEAEAFRKLAAEQGTTAGELLRLYVQSTLEQEAKGQEKPATGNYLNHTNAVLHQVSYRNTERLMHETAFYNPNNRNPSGILNDILDEYFEMVERVRTRTR